VKNVAIEKSQETLVVERLQALGVALLSEWDVLVFIYRRLTTLGTGAQISRLIGHDKAETGAALDRLEELGLVQRSRDSRGTRLYKFSMPSEPSHNSCLLALMSLTQNRTGRLLLLKHLKRPRHEPGRRRNKNLHLVEGTRI